MRFNRIQSSAHRKVFRCFLKIKRDSDILKIIQLMRVNVQESGFVNLCDVPRDTTHAETAGVLPGDRGMESRGQIRHGLLAD